MPLIDTPKHKKYHASGPKDLKWGKAKTAVCFITVTRSTIDNEQMTVNVPVFSDDSRADLDLRLGMFMSLPQERMEDANLAWQEVNEKAKRDSEEKEE